MENINDEKFKRCIEDLGILMQKTTRIFNIYEREQLKKVGLSSSQSYILIAILKNGKMTMNDISENMSLDTSTITRILDNLVRDGLINRIKNEKDRRIVEAELTDKGILYAENAKKTIEDQYKRIIESLPAGHVREVMNSFEVLVEAMDKEK